MFDGKFVCMLVAIFVAVLAICNFKNTNTASLTEKYVPGHSMTTRVQRVAGDKSGFPFFTVQNLQSQLSPRMMGEPGTLSAAIRYNCPSRENMAVPSNPLSMASMAESGYKNGKAVHSKEGYCSGCNAVSCGKGGAGVDFHAGKMMKPDYAVGNYNNVVASVPTQDSAITDGMLPLGDMTTVDALGNESQHIIYDRLMFANRRSRLRSQGDPIRGDLAIAPCETGWFRPAVVPSLDLQEGAMNVLIGDGSSQAALNALIYTDSGNVDDTIAGGYNMSTQLGADLIAGQSGINVTAFP